jgi:glyoxylate/hydroxypyruvate reductase A
VKAKAPIRVAVVFPQPHEAQRWADALAQACAAQSIDAEVGPWHDSAARLSPGNASADYAMGWLAPRRFFEANPWLRAFFNAGAGVDAILDTGAVPSTLPIYRLEDAGMGMQMAQYCALECLQRIGQRKDYASDQNQRRWQPRRPLEASDFPVGILGMGTLGTQVAATLMLLGFPVHGFRRSEIRGSPGSSAIQCYAGPEQWQAFLEATRILIVLAPLTPETRGMINAGAIARLLPGAWLINVARGPLVHEPDLLAALDRGKLEGVTLDVFAIEPLPTDSPLRSHPRVNITPHVAACTLSWLSVDQVASKLDAHLRGGEPSGRVDLARAY